jgi:hypothetical protein
MNDEENVSVKAVLVIFSIFLLIGYVFSENRHQEKIQNCDQSTIGYTHRIKSSGKHSALMYYFYVDSIKVISKADKFDANCSFRYYIVKYDKKNTDENIILLDQEINPDSLSLVKAGFKRKKIYYYDNVTSTYKERLEWK